jgi:hypothetical protein
MKYETLTKNVIDAVRNELTGVNKWQVAGTSVREFYGTEAALTEVKAQFLADAILPALDKKHAAALAAELPRKGSKEYNALDAAGVAKWEIQNQAKKDARSTAATMFSRIVGYAFPKEKTESAPKSLETKLLELINDAIGKIEKAESPEFDALTALTHLRGAVSIIAK